ncbi:MAG: STAS domain-containing protein [Actinomycetes bacterium]
MTLRQGVSHVELSLSGHIDTEVGVCLLNTLHRLIQRGETRCIVDLERVKSCGNTGIAALVACHKRASSRGGWVCLRHARPELQSRLASARALAA